MDIGYINIKGKGHKMEQEKVDIVMATYNTNIKFLKEQIESILNQTYKNISLLISDDNSTNKDVEKVLKEYEKKDKRIKVYIQEKNLGYIKNFEFLLKQSNAQYIMFSDHDDIWYKNKVEASIEELKKKNVDLVYCNSTQIDENGKVIKEDYFKYKNIPIVEGKSKLAISRCVGNACSQIFTKSVKEKMLPYTNKVMAQDWIAAFIANENKGIANIQVPLFGYRLHQTNIFGGRNLAQNLSMWKKDNGLSYKSFLKYRDEKVINMAYLDGAVMCEQYCKDKNNKEFIQKLIKYYESLKKSKYINFHLIKYFKFLAGRNLAKKMIKEIAIFHFPIIGYIYYRCF